MNAYAGALLIVGAFYIIWLWASRQRIIRLSGQMLDRIAQVTADKKLADWARDTMLTVTTRTGTVYAITLADLHAHEIPDRTWNYPLSVTVWCSKYQHERAEETRD